MLDKKEFKAMSKNLAEASAMRDELSKTSRDIVKLTKKLIFALHRRDLDEAAKLERDLSRNYNGFIKLTKKKPALGLNGPWAVAVQEYVEAESYYKFIVEKKIPSRKKLDVNTELYVTGLCDLSGELVRKALDDVICGRTAEALIIKNLLSEMYGALLDFNPEGELRKKIDMVRWNLTKLEDTMFEVSIRGRLS